jgi:hypothetical protein
MQITLSPCRGLPGQAETSLSVSGDVLSVDGIAFDLSKLVEGDEATPLGDQPFIGTITRIDGEIHCGLTVMLGDDAEPNQPDSPCIVAAIDGPIPVPAARIKRTLALEDEV